MPQTVIPKMFHWTTDYAIGVWQIDEEHQRLFALAEGMHEAMLNGKGKVVMGGLFADLVNYTCFHFAHEEQLMGRLKYPDRRQHQHEHEDLRSRVRAMQARAASGEIAMTIETMHFLMEWIKRHITMSDCRIKDLVQASGRLLVP